MRARQARPAARRFKWEGALTFAIVMLALLAALGTAGVYVLQLLPSRYVVTYLPEPIQALLSRPHVELPTPVATLSGEQLEALLTPLASASPSPVLAESPTPQPTFTPAPLISAFLTLVPSPTPSSMPSSTPVPTPTLTLTPAYAPGPTQLARSTPANLSDTSVLLTGFRHAYQGWNNCGPATLAIALSYFGWEGTQNDTAAFLKPDPEDRNVSPEQMAAYVRSQGYRAIVRSGGTLDILKALLHAGLPVVIEKGFEPDEKLGWMGHYLLLVGYNQSQEEFVAMDSYLGPLQSAPFAETDDYWRQFNRTYLVIYGDDMALTVSQLIGASFDDAVMHQNAMALAQAELAANPDDAYGWFNVGTNYEAMGMHAEAAAAYDRARQLGLPWRMTWYQFGWFEAYLAAGRPDDVLALANATLQSNTYSEEMYYYRARAYMAYGDSESARADYQRALERNPNFTAARRAMETLGP
jgi:tetratricopeptide (TPR) repeat protein